MMYGMYIYTKNGRSAAERPRRSNEPKNKKPKKTKKKTKINQKKTKTTPSESGKAPLNRR